MRISDWSSDVCSSDLATEAGVDQVVVGGLEIDADLAGDRAFLETGAGRRIEIERIVAWDGVDDGNAVRPLYLRAVADDLAPILRIADAAAQDEAVRQLVIHVGIDGGAFPDLLIIVDRKSTRLHSSH